MFKCVFLSGETAAAYLASCYNLIARHLKTAPTFPPRTLFHLFISFATPKAKKNTERDGWDPRRSLQVHNHVRSPRFSRYEDIAG